MLHNFLYRLRNGGESTISPGWRRQLRPAFRPRARIAVLDAPQIASGRRVRHFDISQLPRLTGFRHEVLASGIESLLAMDGMRLPRPTHGVIAFTRPGGKPLDEAVRRQLWEAFEVPVFEQLEWPGGALLAEECEAHSSLHVCARNLRIDRAKDGETILARTTPDGHHVLRLAAGWVWEETSVCACGEMGLRLAYQPLTVRARAAVCC